MLASSWYNGRRLVLPPTAVHSQMAAYPIPGAMPKKSVADVDWAGRRALVRVDFNVPLDDGSVADDTRIRGALPTLTHLLEGGAALILMSHLGRPKGRSSPGFSLAPVACQLEEMLQREVRMAPDCVGGEVERMADGMRAGEVLLLENLRFHSEEEANDPGFARRLAALGDAYVNDAFGTAHRAHASTEGVAHHVGTAVSGLLMQREIAYLADALSDPARPYLAIMGGAKISGKVELIEHLLDRVDGLLIGGGMQFTFLRAQGLEIGDSLLEEETVDTAAAVLAAAAAKQVDLLLPTDTVAADRFAADAATRIVEVTGLSAGWQGLDIGPETRSRFAARIAAAGTVVWNGPLGVCELAPFAAGTAAVAEAVAAATDAGAVTIIGGGDTAAAVRQAGCDKRMRHISTGGGASLECLAGRELPGVAVLDEAE